jgi:hypothetical protein
MPVHHRGGGCYQWGSHGKVYCGRGAKQKAERQGRAAYFHGYRGHEASASSAMRADDAWSEDMRHALGTVGHNRRFTAHDLVEYLHISSTEAKGHLHRLTRAGYVGLDANGYFVTRLGWTWIEGGASASRAHARTSMRAEDDSDAPSIYIKAGEVDLYMDDGNTIVFPSDYGMAHDVSGRSLDECSLFFGPVRVTQRRVDPIPEKASQYFGDDYDAKIAVIDVPTQEWNLVGHVEEIVYFRPGKYEEVWRHEFDPPQPLFKSGDWFQMQLPDDCVLTWKGIERP